MQTVIQIMVQISIRIDEQTAIQLDVQISEQIVLVTQCHKNTHMNSKNLLIIHITPKMHA